MAAAGTRRARMPLEDFVLAKLNTHGVGGTQPFTIFRVPAYVRESNRTAYQPRMVSIGPYYNGDAALRAMEDHKWRYLHDLLNRNVQVTSSLLIQEMQSLEARAFACYSERPELNSDDFVQMLLLDGCFILEFFFKWHTKKPDALCDVGWGTTLITTDLLLLENQIPFFIIERLYDVIAGAQGGRENLVTLLLEYIGDKEPIARPSGTEEINHLLHLYYVSFMPQWSPHVPAFKEAETRVIPRATEMSEAGVTFVMRRSDHDMFAVKFDSGVMEIPVVEVDDMKRPLLVNLIAFEQSRGEEKPRVLTSYVALMSMLARTKEDVELLRRHGILVNLLANDEAAAQFFSHLGDGTAMSYDQQVFAGLYKDVQRYCDSWWPRNRALLIRDYFGSPWSVISIIVAGLVVALTATQTYFTVFPRQH
ncbi:hypothetical protein ACP70R_046503 [Stipagrostis hirtigluma subsp. patula]